MTTVINVRGRKRAELENDPNFLYVGRAVPRAGWPTGSIWANPFKVGMDPLKAAALLEGAALDLPGDDDGEGVEPRPVLDAATAVRFFEAYLKAHPALHRRLGELRGKTLGCWCEPDPCHARVLARMADDLDEGGREP